jgi:hypothetical protein
MSSIQDLLKLRQAAVNAAKLDGAVPGGGDPTKPSEVDPKALEGLPPVTTSINTSTVDSAPSVDEAKAAASMGVYRKGHVKKLVLANGSIVRPDSDGYFYAATAEEAEMLDYFNAKGMVEKQ